MKPTTLPLRSDNACCVVSAPPARNYTDYARTGFAKNAAEAGVELQAVGSAEEPFLERLRQQTRACTFTGTVPDIAPYLDQARIAIGGGGLTGYGLFHGPQTQGRFVPVNESDFVFTVAGEELGFVGAAGSLGTLGVLLEISLKVLPVPVAEATLRFEMDEAAALHQLNAWAGQPLPLSARPSPWPASSRRACASSSSACTASRLATRSQIRFFLSFSTSANCAHSERQQRVAA